MKRSTSSLSKYNALGLSWVGCGGSGWEQCIHYLPLRGCCTRPQHQSCLLPLNSSDLLILKVKLMDNSLYLWVKYNQYLQCFMFICTETTKKVQRGIWRLWRVWENWQMKMSKMSDRQRPHNLNRWNDKLQWWERHSSIKPSTWVGYISFRPLTANTLFIRPLIKERK